MTHEERKMMHRAIRTLRAAGGEISLPYDRPGEPSSIQTVANWLAKHTPRTEQTKRLIKEHRNRRIIAQETETAARFAEYEQRRVRYRIDAAGQEIAAAARALLIDQPDAEEATP